MRIIKSSEEGIAVLELLGQLTNGNGDRELREALATELGRDVSKILLDLSQVTYMDSAGIGELVRCKKTCELEGASLRILIVENNKLWKLLGLSQLIVHYNIFDNRIDAIADLRQSADAVPPAETEAASTETPAPN